MLCAIACGRPNRTCGAQDFVYRDRSCGRLPDGGAPCQDTGDGLCHLRCGSDGECPDSAPFCRTLGLYSGGDFNCNDSVRICRDVDRNDCRQ
jgi:hypothetical protein